MASKPQVADIAAERFERLEAENAALRQRLAANEARIKDFCRIYSDSHGYRIRMSREQVRAIFAAKNKPSQVKRAMGRG